MMVIEEQRMTEQLQPLIKIIKQRQKLFFELLGFAKKNIESSSNQFDQIAIFTKFILSNSQADAKNTSKANQFLKFLTIVEQKNSIVLKISNTSKQMMRLYAKVMQIIQSSIQKTINSIFNQTGQITTDFFRFKKSVHKIIQACEIQLLDFVKIIINFCKNKYKRQLNIIKNYIQRLKDGQNVSLRDMFTKVRSDVQSPDQNQLNQNIKSKPKQQQYKNKQQSPVKRVSIKRPQVSKSKKHKCSKKQRQQSVTKNKQIQQAISKSATANLLLKFYSLMDLNKKQFLQDHIFEGHQEQKQRKRLSTILLEKNKFNSEQIRQYTDRCKCFQQKFNSFLPNIVNNNENIQVAHNDQTLNVKISTKTSFLISKRKPSFAFQSVSDRSDVEIIRNQINISKTIKNLSRRRKLSLQKSKQASKSKKIFIVKAPIIFDEDVIPKTQKIGTGWVQGPLTAKQRGRKNESLRVKMRNNPFPIEDKMILETSRPSQNPY